MALYDKTRGQVQGSEHTAEASEDRRVRKKYEVRADYVQKKQHLKVRFKGSFIVA